VSDSTSRPARGAANCLFYRTSCESQQPLFFTTVKAIFQLLFALYLPNWEMRRLICVRLCIILLRQEALLHMYCLTTDQTCQISSFTCLYAKPGQNHPEKAGFLYKFGVKIL